MDKQEEQARRARRDAARERLRGALRKLALEEGLRAKTHGEASGSDGRGMAAGQAEPSGQ